MKRMTIRNSRGRWFSGQSTAPRITVSSSPLDPVPTDDGRWVLSINEWTDQNQAYASVVAAIDGALALIKQTVDAREAGAAPADSIPATPEAAGEAES